MVIRDAISVHGLRKSNGDHMVLDGMDLEVPAGTVFAMPNASAMARVSWARSLMVRPGWRVDSR